MCHIIKCCVICLQASFWLAVLVRCLAYKLPGAEERDERYFYGWEV